MNNINPGFSAGSPHSLIEPPTAILLERNEANVQQKGIKKDHG
nr:MAG TPA: hypothetical protein [Bacteriophage sp.]